MNREIKETIKIELEYEKRNEEIVDSLLAKKITTREAIKEMNKNLGHTLLRLEDKYKI